MQKEFAMPRRPRMYLPDIPAHIVQRGNNRNPCFFTEDDYRFYLDRLSQALKRYQVKLHAYVLMTNHVHLLMTPTDECGISKVMSLLGQHYVRYINHAYRRSGTLWEGRHKSSLIQAEEYLLLCYRYIELNPVRAGMVVSPEDYPWSSYRHHGWGEQNRLISEHNLYMQLGHDKEERCFAYREIFKAQLSERDVHRINHTIHYNYPLGNDRFKEKIEEILKCRIGHAKKGRPPSSATG
ncbi:MAG: transposase [Thiotrichales bacterium]|nr:transposase [Thiotrichales bacterium]